MRIDIDMLRQPSDTSCGPTCLHAIYRFLGQERDLNQLIDDIHQFEDGGTISVHLAIDALAQGFRAKLYTYNLRIFDPTWWNLSPEEMAGKLQQRIQYLADSKDAEAHTAYIEFLEMGGELRFADLRPELVEKLVEQRNPILVGLSATYLYQSARETPDNQANDVAGWPVGHFVVLSGYEPETSEVIVADPFEQNPFNPGGIYRMDVNRFINAVLLGITTYDANLLIISKRQ